MRLKPYEQEANAKKNREVEESTGNPLLDEMLAEEDEMRQDEENMANGNKSNEVVDHEDDDLMPAPQVRVGPDGEIILDDRSLVKNTFFQVNR